MTRHFELAIPDDDTALIDEARGVLSVEGFIYFAAKHMAERCVSESTPEQRLGAVPAFAVRNAQQILTHIEGNTREDGWTSAVDALRSTETVFSATDVKPLYDFIAGEGDPALVLPDFPTPKEWAKR